MRRKNSGGKTAERKQRPEQTKKAADTGELFDAMDTDELGKHISALGNVTDAYPAKISGHCRDLLKSPGDPLWRQFVPSPEELSLECGLEDDGLGEKAQSPCPGLIHRYPDRVLVLAASDCFSYCRFCFRKRIWKRGSSRKDLTGKELSDISSYLESHPEVKDVLVSGGDPLTLPDERLLEILQTLSASGKTETLRLCTRAPLSCPERITDALTDALGEIRGLWFVTHFNHPDELDERSLSACRRIRLRGIPVLNQTVLLAGVNDDAETLKRLFRKLVSERIKPHYLFSADPIRGTAHFAVPVTRGLEILRSLRAGLSSIATPTYAIDLPSGGGKVPLQPDYSCGEDGVYEGIDGRRIFHPLARKHGIPGVCRHG